MFVAHGAYAKPSAGLGCEQLARPCCVVEVTRDVMENAKASGFGTGAEWVLGSCDAMP